MQVTDLLIQYQNNLASGSEISTGTKGIEQLVETAKQLQIGNIFEGTVNSIKGTQVILGLSSGQNITARLDKGIVLEKGQSVFFQVKANDGEQVQIKPISLGGNSGNPTLIQALDAANLPVNEKNLNMVNAMMKEQMPISAKNLQEMSRLILQSEVSDPASVVEMKKLDIPITKNNVYQFQNYKADAGAVLSQVHQLVEQIPEAILSAKHSLSEGISLNHQLISFFAGEEAMMEQQPTMVSFRDNSMPQASEVLSDVQVNEKLLPQEEYPHNSLGRVLPKEQFIELAKSINEFPQFMKEYSGHFTDKNVLRPEVPIKDFLLDFSKFLYEHQREMTKETVSSFVNNKGYKELLSNLITNQWTIEPEELKAEHSVRDLYQKMEMQLSNLQEIVSKYPKANETVAAATKDLSGNIAFMNQINQAYAYVQIPLRLQGQNVNSELFVYRKNREKKGEDEPLSAFLHFDMEVLGGMDISVKLHRKNVSTNWYLEKEEAYLLISENMHILSAKLEQKGYHCDMKVENESKKVNFVEHLLKDDAKTGGQVHRYSFDVRA